MTTRGRQQGAFGMHAVGINCSGLSVDGDAGSEKPPNGHWSGVQYDPSTGNLLIETPQALFPNGLVRVWLIDTSTDRVFTWLPRLLLYDGFWYGKEPLRLVIGCYDNSAQIEIHAVEPASPDNRELFGTDQVRTFVAGLDPESNQAELANEFLRGHST